MKAAVYTGTRNLYKHMIPAVKSLICNSDVEKVYLLIEDDTFPYDLPGMVQAINISNQRYFPQDGPNMNNYYTYMAMIRVAFSKIFPDLDRILSLDVDTIVVDDISDIWDLEFGDCYLAACHEKHRTKGLHFYANAGVALFNLKLLRETGKTNEMIQMLNSKKYWFLDQDVMNIACQGYIYDLPSEYNVNHYTEAAENPKILHHIWGMRRGNLQTYPDVIKYANMSFEELRK